MKKFNNILLICALILVLIGNLLYWGAKGYKYFKRDTYNKDVGNKQYEVYGEIHSVDISAQYADIEIRTGQNCGCYVENMDTSKTKAYVSNGTMYVKAANRDNMVVLGWNIGNIIDPGDRAKIVVYIPEEAMKNFRIDLGTGKVSAKDLKASNFVLQLGAGNISIEKLTVTGNGAIQLGGGKAGIEKLEAKEFTIRSGAASIDAGLTSVAGEYDVQASSSIGSIKIFDSKKIGIAKEMLHRGDGFRHLNIENGAGNVTVHF